MISNKLKLPHPDGSGGLTLIEVLIALVVLSIGLLGIAALQITSLSSTHSAFQRTVASVIAADAGERLWASLATGAVDTAGVRTEWLDHWRNADNNPEDLVTLPDLGGNIVKTGETTYTISVTWAEARFNDSDDSVSSFEYVINLLPDRS